MSYISNFNCKTHYSDERATLILNLARAVLYESEFVC